MRGNGNNIRVLSFLSWVVVMKLRLHCDSLPRAVDYQVPVIQERGAEKEREEIASVALRIADRL